MIRNFKELAKHITGDPDATPYYVGRCLYKYTDCGPWCVFPLDKAHEVKTRERGWGKPIEMEIEEGKTEKVPQIEIKRETKNVEEIYYEDSFAYNTDLIDHITGIRIGSIVEGSDVELDPQSLTFPFEEKAIDEAVKAINDEAAFYWERDNSDWFCLIDPQAEEYYFHNSWGEIKWDGDKPEDAAIIEKVTAFCEDHYPGFWKKDDEMCGAYTEIHNDYDTPIPFMDTDWMIKAVETGMWIY